GLIDVYFLNGAPLRGSDTAEPPRNRLYRNEGDWRFRDVTEAANLGDLGFGLGVTVGDFDNDGFPDLYLNNFGPNVLYRNRGDGTFEDVTQPSGVGNGNLVGAGTCFLDMDADGDLDLFVGNYLEFSYEDHVVRTIDGNPRYPVPRDFQAIPDSLFRNNGDGTFTDVSVASGIALVAGTTMGTVCADYDADGDTDIFAVCDVAANLFYQNDGNGHFQEAGLLVGTAYNGIGDENGSMGVDCGDVDNDGWLDFFMTSYQGELPVLYRNLGNGAFEDATQVSGAGEGSLPHVNWGLGLIDFDNDADLDLFIANGHTEDNIDLWDDRAMYRATNLLLVNDGHGHFVNGSETAGSGLRPAMASRGAAFDDLDNDGDVDAIILNSRNRPTVARNDSNNNHHWLEIGLHGVTSNRGGVGAQVSVIAGDVKRVTEVHSGRSYQSYYGGRLHIGLGPRTHVDRVEVRWIGGGRDTITDLAADQRIAIRQGTATAVPIHRSGIH
ncbi:MAG: CRTAC1 family protein, partial [Planctomycetes bacterium]|nr:CRTAC1 family protein [Planctomycetota bacterium]